MATLIPKLRVHFAEFLNEGSPAHLRILSPHTCVGLRITPRAYRVRICLYPTPHACTRTSIPVRACLPVSLPRSNNRCRFRNLNRMSISYASCLGLGPDLPWDDDRCPGILMLSVGRILTALFATHANILTSCQSTVPYSTASARQERSSTTQPLRLHP